MSFIEVRWLQKYVSELVKQTKKTSTLEGCLYLNAEFDSAVIGNQDKDKSPHNYDIKWSMKITDFELRKKQNFVLAQGDVGDPMES